MATRGSSRAAVAGWSVVLLAHAAASVLAYALLPHGFAPWSARAWANDVLPIAVAVAALGAVVVALARPRSSALGAAASAVAGAWTSGAALAAMLFPVSGARVWPIALAVGAFFALGSRALQTRGSLRALGALVGALVGGLLVFAQRSPPPGTRAVHDALPALPTSVDPLLARAVALSPDAVVDVVDGATRARCGGVDLRLRPLLTFTSRSPDRTWTLLAPDPFAGDQRTLVGASFDAPTSTLRLAYADGDGSTRGLVGSARDDALELDAWAELPRPVYSHLNTLLELHAEAPSPLTLVFSPAPDRPIEPVVSDYPVGRPARFAWLDARERFHVAEARSAEKGPFRDLASGALARGEPLAITLRAGGAPACVLTLLDWSHELDVGPSPTAGWGVASNAIEFRATDDSHRAFDLFVTLAGTSVGRGFDSVAHAAGRYESRVTVAPAR